MAGFTGLSDGDFEAYAPKKWKSNVFNRERLEVKQKLLALGIDSRASTPEEMAQQLQDDTKQWAVVIDHAGIEKK